MPEAQQENCPGIYAQTVVSWDRLLENHYRADGTAGGGGIELRFRQPGGAIERRLLDLLKGSQALKDEVAVVSARGVLPAGFEVVFAAGGELTAYTFSESAHVTNYSTPG